MGSKSVGRSRTPQPTFRRRGDFSPVSTLAAGDFNERDARSNASQPAVPSFREVSRFARGGGLAADPPEDTSTARPQGRDTRHADRKIMAFPRIRSRRVGTFAAKVGQLRESQRERGRNVSCKTLRCGEADFLSRFRRPLQVFEIPHEDSVLIVAKEKIRSVTTGECASIALTGSGRCQINIVPLELTPSQDARSL